MAPRPLLGLSMKNYKIGCGSVLSSADGVTFAFTIWSLPDDTASAIEAVARNHGRICLYCNDRPLLFDLIAVEREELGKTRIVGRIVGVA
jgi:hypothetical protein